MAKARLVVAGAVVLALAAGAFVALRRAEPVFRGDVRTAAERACATMVGELATVPPAQPTKFRYARLQVVEAENSALYRLERDMRSSTPMARDPLGRRWLDDWVLLADSRVAFALGIGYGATTLEIPFEDGPDALVARIERAAPGCHVPERLYRLSA